jgi:glyoxylase-like metal-dependent hydrolase (beta-lactamase superfamily II)
MVLGVTAPGSWQALTAQAATDIRLERVRQNLYVLRGGGPVVQIGNTGITLEAAGTTLAFIASAGVVLVDPKLPGLGKPVLDALKTITDKPVTAIINTHAHDDHVGSNSEFGPQVEIIAQENAARRIRGTGGRGIPTRTFKERLTLGTGDERIDLYYFGVAHTDGDTWVVFPALGVVHVGDVFAYRTVPIVDTTNGGNAIAYAPSMDAAIAGLPQNLQTVITGHYPTTQTMDDLKTYADFVRGLIQAAQAARAVGGTSDQFVAGYVLPDRFMREGYVVAPLVLRPFVQAVWNQSN